ncbi:hypothetical protein [Ferruginibacter sp.]
MSCTRLFILLLLLSACYTSDAQTDSTLQALQQVPVKYIDQTNKKISTYTNRITSKTEKTLTKLSRWENKIKAILEKASPATAQQLFGANQLTFTAALEKYKKGEAVIAAQRARYDEYRDKLSTSIKYLETQKQNIDDKLVQPVSKANKKLAELEDDEQQQQAMEAFIKERKKQLIDQSLKYLGNSKWLAKMDKEAYYYVETIRNYKELFHDKKKAEQTALTLLNKIPAFKKFSQQNSMLAALFGGAGGAGSTANLAGLQTRASVTALIQNQIAAGGPNAQAQIMQNIQAAQAQLSQLKDKVLKAGGSNSDLQMPDFKPNEQKTKTFLQRLEFGSNLQFAKNNSLVPTTADIGLSLGYKLNSKGIAGIGASYKAGLGSIQRISFSHQGVGLRSFIDWQLKKQFYISGGYEMNYNAAFKNIDQPKRYDNWQQSGLIGLSKKLNIKTKFTKGTKLSLLYDMLAGRHVPVSQPVVFRVGYNF